jgi:tRNA G10  N-methylase Trm11
VEEYGPFDVLLADPPYGKREKGRERAEGAVEEAAWALVGLAASSLLRVGGRATFFLPSHPSLRDIRDVLPSHGCLVVQQAVCQPMHLKLNRWLITLRKVGGGEWEGSFCRRDASR